MDKNLISLLYSYNCCFYIDEFVKKYIIKEENKINIPEDLLDDLEGSHKHIFSINYYNKNDDRYYLNFFTNNKNKIYCKVITIDNDSSYDNRIISFYKINCFVFYDLIKYLFLSKLYHKAPPFRARDSSLERI